MKMGFRPRAICAAGAAAAVVTLAATAIGLGAPAASATTVASSFAGKCAPFEGDLLLAHGVTTQSHANSFTFRAASACSGTVDGTAKTDQASTLTLSGTGSLSCLAGSVPLTGTLSVAGGSIPVRGTLKITTPNVSVSLIGTGSGLASGSGTVLTAHQNYLSMGECFTSSGLEKADIKFSLATSAPLVAPAPPAASGTHHHAKKTHEKKQH